MAASAIQTILDNARNLVIKVTVSAAESLTPLVQPALLEPVCTRVRLARVQYDVGAATTVSLLWDATTPVNIITLNSSLQGDLDFTDCIAGLPNNAGAGVTGKVMMTTVGTGSVTLILYFLKTDPIINN